MIHSHDKTAGHSEQDQSVSPTNMIHMSTPAESETVNGVQDRQDRVSEDIDHCIGIILLLS